MDRRRSLWLAAGALAGLVGCSHRVGPGATTAKLPPPPTNVNQSQTIWETSKSDKLSPKTYLALGHAHLTSAADATRSPEEKAQQAKSAVANYKQALALDAKLLPAHIGLAKSLELTGDAAGSQTSYKTALDLAPQEPGVWYEIGMARARAGDYAGAIESLKHCCELAPENAGYAKAIGFTLARSGRTEEALPWLAKAVGEPDAHFNLARMMAHLERPDLARGHLHATLRLKPDHLEAQELLHALPADPASAVQPVRYEVPAQPVAPAEPQRALEITSGGAADATPPPAQPVGLNVPRRRLPKLSPSPEPGVQVAQRVQVGFEPIK